MIKGYSAGMLNLYDIERVALIYDNADVKGVLAAQYEIIKNNDESPEWNQYCNNLDFMLHVMRSILSIKCEDASLMVRFYLRTLIEKNYDYTYSYNWQELKSILFYCIYMSNLKDMKGFAKNMENPIFGRCLATYILNDSVLPGRKIKAHEELSKTQNEYQIKMAI